MAYQRDTFTNPATSEAYAWPVNHSEEGPFGKRRNLTSGAPTGGLGLIIQQGDDEPMTLELSGTIMHKAQHDAFVRWYAISRQQTIYFTDFTGESYEVIIVAFDPTRHRTVRNPRDRTIPLHYWTYTLRMQVLRFLSAPWNQVTP